MQLTIPNRASDSGPDSVETPHTPEELVSLAEEHLNLYRKVKREASLTTTRTAWLRHLRTAVALLDAAEAMEIQ
jgi:hypothetical protein